MNMLTLGAIGGGLALVSGFFGGWTVRDWKADSDELTRVDQLIEAKDALASAQFRHADQYLAVVEQLNAQTNTDRTTIREIYRERENDAGPIECLPAPVAGVLNDAISRANQAATTGSIDPALSASAISGPIEQQPGANGGVDSSGS